MIDPLVQKLIELRAERGLPGAALARLTFRGLEAWETGRKSPTLRDLRAWAEALGTVLEDVMFNRVGEPVETSEVPVEQAACTTLSPQAKARLAALYPNERRVVPLILERVGGTLSFDEIRAIDGCGNWDKHTLYKAISNVRRALGGEIEINVLQGFGGYKIIPAVELGVVEQVTIDWDARRTSYSGGSFKLSPKETVVLRALTRRPGFLVRRDALHQVLYGLDSNGGPDLKVIDVYLAKIRPKLPARSIQTIPWAGYRWVGPPPEERSFQERPAAGPEITPTPTSPAPVRTVVRRLPRPVQPKRPVVPAGPSNENLPKPPPALEKARAAELNDIEKFLAMRGPTVCPPVGSEEVKRLEDLKWDRKKRRYTRGSIEEPAYSWGHR